MAHTNKDPNNRPRTAVARRDFLQRLLAVSLATVTEWPAARAVAASPPPAPAPTTPASPAPATAGKQPFSTDWLRDHARKLAAAPYQAPPKLKSEALANLGSEAYQNIRFEPDHALWRTRNLDFQLRFFHLGYYYREPVRIYQVVDGAAEPVLFSKDMFDYGDNHFDPPLPDDLGFAGLRVHYHTDFSRDMAAFLGASYFRAVGAAMQYGISARGIAIDTALPTGEEFPGWRSFWIERPKPGVSNLTVHALLDGPSVTGAYRFLIQPGRTTVMMVEAFLFPRKPIKRLGLSPLTSMYQHGENDHRIDNDYRPEVHDSDGLAILRGNGERIWRPLDNPAALRVNTFSDENPRGFGLLQRDRRFRDYQDDSNFYNLRPNLWVEPQGQWGKGAIYLIEIPTNQEIFDNIVAFWVPEAQPQPGKEIRLKYNLSWGSRVPDIYSPVARVVATRTGIGDTPDPAKRRHLQKFVIDFKGGPLELLEKHAPVEPVITASHGEIDHPTVRFIRELGNWRADFNLKPEGDDPVESALLSQVRQQRPDGNLELPVDAVGMTQPPVRSVPKHWR